MNIDSAPLIVWSFGLAAGAYTLFAAYLLIFGPSWQSGRRARALGLAIACSLLWAWLSWAMFATGQPPILFALSLGDVLRHGAWFAFLVLLLTPEASKNGKGTILPGWLVPACWLSVIGGLVWQLSLFFGLLADEDWQRTALFLALAMPVLGLILVEQLFRGIADDAVWNIKPLCLALGGQFVYDIYLFSEALMFNRLDPDAFAVRGIVHATTVPLLLLATLRNRNWTAKIRLSQRAAFHSASLLMAGLYLMFMAGVGYYVRYFGGDWGRALQLALVFAAILGLGMLAVSGSMRAKMRVLVGKHFFRYRYDYREEWLRFTRTLSAQESPQALGQQVIRGLAAMVESPAGGLWLCEAGQGNYRQAARWNAPACEEPEPPESSLVQFLIAGGWVINLAEYRSHPGRYGKLEIPVWLSGLPNAWLLVPLMVGSQMTGFVILASSRTPIDVNWEVNDLLRTAGCQAAGFLANMQATEALLEARKFDAFNRMSAFVVHDLKNIVTQLSLMLKNAERHRANPEFQQDMLMTVEHSVERMRQLMMQLREGATPPGTTCGVNLSDVIERIRGEKASQGRSVEVQLQQKLAARGHEDRLERVIGHLVQNALDATDPSGRVTVSLERRGDRAALEVGDTGHGMTTEFIRERLFKPFQSTKRAGMGIGAYESSQYIRELGGEMLVDSEPGQGTRITVLLPLFEVSSESDLREKEPA
ncbi:XrtA/PEP-CTERM system histidine kinase PrsK [Azonexus sp.]|jgi:putative PEP-CTERM system histidine kinase|uniref:XrtA/PEP-CTERM system histidine kinase PrsK n=1 Tax=Azonexus sp. TaxID=1872668 RepID=UPI002825CA37|nr:XrtA/PEP-CTERM system histidine kinase PrsK [Azonexus sp.]MDR1996251.1 PEP-CTERM system histidine kinase PrsK [Azonexus sp.]